MTERCTIHPQEKLRQFEPGKNETAMQVHERQMATTLEKLRQFEDDLGYLRQRGWAVEANTDDNFEPEPDDEGACGRSFDGWHHFRFVVYDEEAGSLYRCSECGKESLV